MKIQKGKWLATILGSAMFLCVYYSNLPNIPTTQNLNGTIHSGIVHRSVFEDVENYDAQGIKSKVGKVESSNVTGDAASLRKFFMVFLIPSMPKSKDYRQYLRTKWLNQSCWRGEEFKGVDKRYLDFKLMFVIGKLIYRNYSQEFMEEVSQNNDMYLMDKVESRKILKDKVLWGMRESVKLFDYDYFIKIDHDTLVDLPHLAKGIQGLPKENLLTGSCYNKLRRGEYKYAFRYCSGGAYILSRDVIEKIASLSVNETEIKLGRSEPEDAYTGWLVTHIKEKFNITGLHAKHNRMIVNRVPIHKYHYWFNKWFYHWIKGWQNMDRAFECRMKANFTLCPSTNYFYENINSTACSCINQ